MIEWVNDPTIEYAFALKLNVLKRNGLPQLSMDDLEYAVVHGLWKDQIPEHASDAVDKIFAIPGEDVVKTLHRLAITEGASANLDDLSDLLGGNAHE